MENTKEDSLQRLPGESLSDYLNRTYKGCFPLESDATKSDDQSVTGGSEEEELTPSQMKSQLKSLKNDVRSLTVLVQSLISYMIPAQNQIKQEYEIENVDAIDKGDGVSMEMEQIIVKEEHKEPEKTEINNAEEKSKNAECGNTLGEDKAPDVFDEEHIEEQVPPSPKKEEKGFSGLLIPQKEKVKPISALDKVMGPRFYLNNIATLLSSQWKNAGKKLLFKQPYQITSNSNRFNTLSTDWIIVAYLPKNCQQNYMLQFYKGLFEGSGVDVKWHALTPSLKKLDYSLDWEPKFLEEPSYFYLHLISVKQVSIKYISAYLKKNYEGFDQVHLFVKWDC